MSSTIDLVDEGLPVSAAVASPVVGLAEAYTKKVLKLTPPSGGHSTHVLLHGRPTDWRGEDKTISLMSELEEYAVDRLYLIDPAKCNVLVVPTSSFEQKEVLAPLPLYTAFAEGVVLDKPGDACLLKSADCPTIIMVHPLSGKTVVGHGALDALIDPKMVNLDDAKNWRKPAGVIDSMIEQFPVSERNLLAVYVVLGISSQYFRNSCTWNVGGNNKYYTRNLRLRQHLRCKYPSALMEDMDSPEYGIDLFEIIRIMCTKAGVLPENIIASGYETYGQVDAEGQHLWHSNRRDGARSGRNAVVVIR